MPRRLLVLEPFYGGSHKMLVDFVVNTFKDVANEEDVFLVEQYTLPAKKWQWRARTSALYFSSLIPADDDVEQTKSSRMSSCSKSTMIVLCSSVLNLAELCALRVDLHLAKKIVYFHENQLFYPVQASKGSRDFQFGYNEIVTAMVADEVVFNSKFNLSSFVNNVDKHFNLSAKPRPRNVGERISKKASVIYFPVHIPKHLASTTDSCHKMKDSPLTILWNHRWEHDKNASSFFSTLIKLKEEHKANFRLRVLGQSFDEVPQVFEEAKTSLQTNIEHWGFVESKEKYYELIASSDLVVSTANHEFFGVAVWEAAALGCYPLVPDRLVYPELYPSQCEQRNFDKFNEKRTDCQLLKRLRSFCADPGRCRRARDVLSAHFQRDLESEAREAFSKLFQDAQKFFSKDLNQC